MNAHLLVEDVAAKVSYIAQSVALVGNSRLYGDLKMECLDDLRRGYGPLAGIEAALTSGRGDLNLIVACDMPGIRVQWLEQLVMKASQDESDCIVCQDATGAVHPLCSAWKKSCLVRVQRALDEGRLRVGQLINELNPAYVSISDAIPNVNTPEEWTAWQARELQERLLSANA